MIKIKIIKNTLERNFTVDCKGKTYYVGYLNSDGQILGLLNRNYWEILDEDLEEVSEFCFRGSDVRGIEKNVELKLKLINFCIKHFNDYKPNINP